ncbi:MAG TPA: DUF5666 domain-containing protein [Acidimicrobiales bacterium]|nr:DUF5666 domain-containing protein [Acidimicrobiales bacterium]
MSFEIGSRRRREPGRRRLVAAVSGSTVVLAAVGAGFALAANASATPARARTTASSSKSAPLRHGRGSQGGGDQGSGAAPGTAGGAFQMPSTLTLPSNPGGPDGLSGVVTAFTPADGATNGTLSFDEADGTLVTVATTSSTTFRSAQFARRLGVVVVSGDEVSVRPTPSSDGTSSIVAASVVVAEPSLSGTVVSFSGSTITISDSQLFRRAIDVGGSTSFYANGRAATSSVVTAGSHLIALGTLDSTETVLDASQIDVLEQQVTGVVGTVSGSTFTLSGPNRSNSITVTTNGSTTFYAGGATSTITSVTQGARVAVLGTREGGSTFLASTVTVLSSRDDGSGSSDAGYRQQTPSDPTGSTGAMGATGPTGPTGSTGRNGHHHRHGGQGGQGGGQGGQGGGQGGQGGQGGGQGGQGGGQGGQA